MQLTFTPVILTKWLVATAAMLAALCLTMSQTAMAQTSRGTVTEVKDSRIDSLIAHRLVAAVKPQPTASHTLTTAAGTAFGYRVQFYLSPNRAEAYNAQAKLNELVPDLKTYISYTEPNFKVRAGDFRTRLEAEKFKEKLKGTFTALFIIPEKINLPKTDNSND